tara:strand:+ start:226 stop:573 length:348 start_codon:yes stop_codon:yes gene_type:complete
MKLPIRFCHLICLALILFEVSACNENPDEAAGTSSVQSREQQPNPGYTIDDEEIVSISAHIMNHPEGGEDIPAFEIPTKYHSRVLGFFQGAERFRVQIDPMVRGTLTIKTADNQI